MTGNPGVVAKFHKLKYNTAMDAKEKKRDKKIAASGTQLSDTSPHIREILIAGYRRMSPRQKLKRVDELTKAIQQLALSRIRQQYKGASEREQQLRLASLWLDRETMLKVFNWDPDVEGY